MTRDKAAHHGKIIAAAREEFMTFGFTDASMRRIAAAAGMSAAGLYRHFPGKEEMFAALVEPAFQGMMALYRKEEAAQRDAARSGSLTGQWENGSDARLTVSYIYDHLDAFRLLVCKSAGTRYESFLHDFAEVEEKSIHEMLNLMEQNGTKLNSVRPEELHLLITANVNAVFQVVEHGFTREEAIHYADTLDLFFGKAWQAVFGY